MPPRWLSVLIVLFWLMFTGTLAYRELLPRLLPGQAPPFTIDLVEEANATRPTVTWSVQLNGRDVGSLRTRVVHPGRDEYHLQAEFNLRGREFYARLAYAILGAGDPFATLVMARGAIASHRGEGEHYRPGSLPAGGLRVLALSSAYRVNAGGEFLGFAVHFEAAPEILDGTNLGGFDVTINGDVSGNQLRLVREFSGAMTSRFVSDLPGRGLLLPLHPPKRLANLTPGQSWSAVVFDPLTNYLVVRDPVLVRASVRLLVEEYAVGNRGAVPCLVIDYEGDGVKMTLWVSRENGNVLRQEVVLGQTQWVVTRN